MNLQDAKELIRNHLGQFYTYLLKRPDGRPFYVGKGNCRGFRIEEHYKEALSNREGNYKVNVIRKIWRNGGQVDYEIVLFGKDEKIVFEKERELIKFYGRMDNGKGILTNMTDGGEGIYGFVFSEESRRKMSEARKGCIKSEETKRRMSDIKKGTHLSEETKRRKSEVIKRDKNPFFGKSHTEETKRKISEARKGKTLSEEHKRKISLNSAHAMRGKVLPEEHRKKLSESMKLFWIKRKGNYNFKKYRT